MNDIEKIRQEIKRLYDGEAPKHDQQCEFEDGYFTGIATISKFLDTLPEEKQSEDLEKAANNCIAKFADYIMAENAPEEINLTEKLREIFKAGAEWIAGQGVSTVAISSAEDGITEEGMKLIADYLESLPDKTEVVLQIRKKQ